MGLYIKAVEELHTPYEVPQENGNRTDTRWLAMRGASETGLVVKRADKSHVEDTSDELGWEDIETFDFAAHHYEVEVLEQAQHPTELRKKDEVFFRIDAAHHGLGTGSCGPGVQTQYKLQTREMRFTFLIEPI